MNDEKRPTTHRVMGIGKRTVCCSTAVYSAEHGSRTKPRRVVADIVPTRLGLQSCGLPLAEPVYFFSQV